MNPYLILVISLSALVFQVKFYHVMALKTSTKTDELTLRLLRPQKPSNAKPSQIRVVVIENGLGSQPEKRSLQADSASRLISLYTSTTKRWLKAKSIVWRVIVMLTAPHSGHVPNQLDQGSFLNTIGELLNDANLARWFISLAATLYLVRLHLI